MTTPKPTPSHGDLGAPPLDEATNAERAAAAPAYELEPGTEYELPVSTLSGTD